MSCWITPRDIPPSADYPAAIVEAVRSARVLVLLLTEHTTGSPHILSEVGHAFNGKKRIIPFRLSTGPLPEDLEYFLSLTQWLEGTGRLHRRQPRRDSPALAGKKRHLGLC